MEFRPLKSFFPSADELLAADLPRLGEVLLVHLKSFEASGSSLYENGQIPLVIYQNGLITRDAFFIHLRGHGSYGPLRGQPEYPQDEPEVRRAITEAWYWLEHEGLLVREAGQQVARFSISRKGEELLSLLARYEHWEELGVDRVKHDLLNGGFRAVGGPPEDQELVRQWVRLKEGQAALPPRKRAGASGGSSFIAETRIDELRKLSSPNFDFQKLVRLCEELNSSYNSGNYYATAMLTRGVLDHVPPLFGFPTFTQVANNYSGGGRSFKETMLHLEGAARKISDGYLHMPIRKSETLPTPQQVYCGSQLDVLLAEIVRITK